MSRYLKRQAKLLAIACVSMGAPVAAYMYTNVNGSVLLDTSKSQISSPSVAINQPSVVQPKNVLEQEAARKDEHDSKTSEIATLEEVQYEMPLSGGVGIAKISGKN